MATQEENQILLISDRKIKPSIIFTHFHINDLTGLIKPINSTQVNICTVLHTTETTESFHHIILYLISYSGPLTILMCDPSSSLQTLHLLSHHFSSPSLTEAKSPSMTLLRRQSSNVLAVGWPAKECAEQRAFCTAVPLYDAEVRRLRDGQKIYHYL